MRRPPIAASVAVILLLAACARDATPTEPSSSPPSAPAAHGSLADCLQEQGVPAAAGGPAVLGPPPGVSQESWDAAMKACSTLAPGPAAP